MQTVGYEAWQFARCVVAAGRCVGGAVVGGRCVGGAVEAGRCVGGCVAAADGCCVVRCGAADWAPSMSAGTTGPTLLHAAVSAPTNSQRQPTLIWSSMSCLSS